MLFRKRADGEQRTANVKRPKAKGKWPKGNGQMQMAKGNGIWQQQKAMAMAKGNVKLLKTNISFLGTFGQKTQLKMYINVLLEKGRWQTVTDGCQMAKGKWQLAKGRRPNANGKKQWQMAMEKGNGKKEMANC